MDQDALFSKDAFTGFTATPEQTAIVDAVASGENTVVEALAGTGKTTTMRLAAEARRGRGFYIVFNKAAQVDAKKTFPKSCQVRTAHSLAHQTVARTHGSKLPKGRVRPFPAREAVAAFGIEGFSFDKDRVMHPNTIASMAKSTVTRFCQSAHTELVTENVPWMKGLGPIDWRALAAHVLPYAQAMWKDIAQPEGGKVPLGHDHYLKIWALTEPVLAADYVIVDECQDTNPVLEHVVVAQDTQLVAVGDRLQTLYGWRGTSNLFRRITGAQRLALTESWRFGPVIAREANIWLGLPVMDTDLRLTGRGGPSTVAALDEPDAILCRTNAAAVLEVMAAIDAGTRVALVGGATDIATLAHAAIDLQAGRGTTHPELAAFPTWDALRQYVNEEDDSDLGVFVKLIDKHGADDIITTAAHLVPENRAQLTVSTAHKSKGRQWPRVKIGDDFRPPPLDENGKPKPIDAAEAMLAYVAVTRAERVLDRDGLEWIDDHRHGRPTAKQAAAHQRRGPRTAQPEELT